ncbi:unnamed protein product [Echinostoma caproni]|uniref:Mucin-5AC n=1 Tax=Echinostoma caproni TaxID=27848 RepID=A0A183AVL1_9TREM|nr:unnamed protein product [Echinostoma caproni]
MLSFCSHLSTQPRQNQWPSGPGCSSKETTSMDVVTSLPQVFDSSSTPCTTSSSSSIPTTSSTTVNSHEQTPTDSLFSSLFTAQHDLSTQFLPGLNAAGITVYPVQVSANGPTVLVAATPSSTSAIGTKGFLNRTGLISIPTVTTTTATTTTTAVTNKLIPTCCAVTCTSTASATAAITNSISGTFAGTLLSPALTVSTTASNSLPRTKPKFKALWESNLGNTAESDGMRAMQTTDSPVGESVPDQTSLLVTSSSTRIVNHISKRQSPILIGSKSIGQTPKRLAASAASAAAVTVIPTSSPSSTPSSSSTATTVINSTGTSNCAQDSERKSPSQLDGGSKKLLLVCSQPQQPVPNSGRLVTTINATGTNVQSEAVVEPTLAKVVTTTQNQQQQQSVGRARVSADSEQSELVFLTNPSVSLASSTGIGGSSTLHPNSQSPGLTTVSQSAAQSGGLFVPNRGTTVVLVNHNTSHHNHIGNNNNNNNNTVTATAATTTTVSAVPTGGSQSTDPTRVAPVPMSVSASDSEVSALPVLASSQKIMVDISQRIMRTDEAVSRTSTITTDTSGSDQRDRWWLGIGESIIDVTERGSHINSMGGSAIDGVNYDVQ